MASQIVIADPVLPWVEGKEDKLFERIVWGSIVLFFILGIVLNTLTLPEVEKKSLKEVSPRLAQLILEKKQKPKPKKKIIKPKPKKKKVKKPEKKKPKPKKKDKPKPKPKKEPDTREAAREKAQQSGLLALQDDLADLRDEFELEEIEDLPQLKASEKTVETVTATDLLTAKATKGSGGIKTGKTTNTVGSRQLASRKKSAVKSNIKTKKQINKSIQSKTRVSTRSQDEIERVFQKNKGAIFSIYNRELRKDPTLQGKVVVELTISPDGKVTKCVIISSELNHKKLEKRLVSKIKKFKFVSKKVEVLTVTYPIFFLPS